MPSPLSELEAQIEAIQADMDFVKLASQLRPRMGSILIWDAQGEGTDIAKKFIRLTTSVPEGVYGPLLVRLLACLERYLRTTIADVVARKTKMAKTYDELADNLGSRNLVLTGRLLSTLDTPRDYLTLNIDEMIDNLASCRKGSSSFKLNALAFSATLAGVNPSVIEKAFDNVDVSKWWDKIGANPKAVALMGTKGTHATGLRVKERLKELAKWRNHVAHGGDGQLVISDSELSDAIQFVAIFSRALDAIVQ
jgi:hypothetical protein